MDKKRAISGFLLSFVFLSVFVYMLSGVKWVLGSNKLLLGDISAVAGSSSQSSGSAIAPDLEINAEAFISEESNLENSQILLSKNSDAILPIASLTKLMTAVVVLDNYNLADEVKVSRTADSLQAVLTDVKIGTTMPVENFLEVMLVASSNKSAYALAEKMGEQKFVGLMNQKAQSIGLQKTFFGDPTGLSPKNVSSAQDLAKLAEYILKNYPKIAEISRIKQLHIFGLGDIGNTDQLLGQIPDIVCSKTGFTIEANGCLLLVINNQKNNDYLINVILGANDRFAEMGKIINWSGLVCK